MSRVIKIIGMAISVCLSGSAALAANLPMKAYQATYDETSSVGGKIVRTYACDGQGHGRSEVLRASGRKDISILDMPNHRVTILMGDTKTAMTMPLRDDDVQTMASFGAGVKAGGKPLGAKMIDGHPCHGFHYDLGQTSEDLWNGDDIGIRVYSKVQTSFGVTESHLRSYSPQAPAPQSFAIPPEYRQMPIAGGPAQ